MMSLYQSQREALAYVRSNAVDNQQAARDAATRIVQDAGLSMQLYERALAAISKDAPIDVSFHPDRPNFQGDNVTSGLLATGEYKSQFETGISNGGLTAFDGGSRDRWERRLFGGAYQKRGVTATERPKYGALNLMNYWDGACPRFGSCYFRLKPVVAQRCTFAYGDSSVNPKETAVVDQFDVVLCRLLSDVFYKHAALGSETLEPGEYLQYLADGSFSDYLGASSRAPGRSLDECIEVHIHGKLDLDRDIAWLAVDSSFYHSDCGRQLTELSQRHGFPIRWNPGFEMATGQVPENFRGPVMVPLAARIAPDGILNAAKIGRAVIELRECPAAWVEWGTFDETLQYLKQIWHVLVAFGVPRDEV